MKHPVHSVGRKPGYPPERELRARTYCRVPLFVTLLAANCLPFADPREWGLGIAPACQPVAGAPISQQQAQERGRVLRRLENIGAVVFEEPREGRRYILGLDFTRNTELDRATFQDSFCLGEMEELVLRESAVRDDWLEGIDRLKRLRVIVLGDTAVTDIALRYLGRNENVEEINLAGCKVTDRGIRELERLRRLKALGLSHTQITDKALPILSALPSLRSLSVACTGVSDEGLARARLPGLELLDVSGDRVSARGLIAVDAPRVRYLYASDTAVTGLSWLADPRWAGLITLDLSGCRVTDAHVLELGLLPNLEVLYLRGAAITARSLSRLRRLSKLRVLDLRSTGITENDCETLLPSGVRVLLGR